MRMFVCMSVTCATVMLAGCSYGPDGGRVGETGQVQVVASSVLPEPTASDLLGQSRSYLIGPLDVLVIDVFGVEGLTDREFAVDGAGRISIPLAGAIQAAGTAADGALVPGAAP